MTIVWNRPPLFFDDLTALALGFPLPQERLGSLHWIVVPVPGAGPCGAMTFWFPRVPSVATGSPEGQHWGNIPLFWHIRQGYNLFYQEC